MEEIVRCMDCGYCDVESWGAWCNKENAKLNDVCDEHECDSFFPRIEKEASYQQLSKALCGKENATLDEMLNAVKQLKHRAEPEMRPLTLEDAQKQSKNKNVVWLEMLGKPYAEVAYVTPTDKLSSICFVYILSSTLTMHSKKYGKLWRCWPRKPTPEQMAAAKWEE